MKSDETNYENNSDSHIDEYQSLTNEQLNFENQMQKVANHEEIAPLVKRPNIKIGFLILPRLASFEEYKEDNSSRERNEEMSF